MGAFWFKVKVFVIVHIIWVGYCYVFLSIFNHTWNIMHYNEFSAAATFFFYVNGSVMLFRYMFSNDVKSKDDQK